jgi:hypothetical protein
MARGRFKRPGSIYRIVLFTKGNSSVFQKLSRENYFNNLTVGCLRA